LIEPQGCRFQATVLHPPLTRIFSQLFEKYKLIIDGAMSAKAGGH